MGRQSILLRCPEIFFYPDVNNFLVNLVHFSANLPNTVFCELFRYRSINTHNERGRYTKRGIFIENTVG